MPAMLGQVHLQSSTNARVNRAFKNTHDLGVMRETASVRLMSCSQRYSWFHFQFGQQEATHCRSCWGLFSSFLCKPSAAYEAEGGGRLSLGSCTWGADGRSRGGQTATETPTPLAHWPKKSQVLARVASREQFSLCLYISHVLF